MKLFTDELQVQLPALYAQEGQSDPMVYIKFFTPDAGWTWYATEGSQEDDDFIFFGFVFGEFAEWGNFSLNELQELRGPMNLPVERDLYFHPAPWSEVKSRHEATHGQA